MRTRPILGAQYANEKTMNGSYKDSINKGLTSHQTSTPFRRSVVL
jgi:hypothetical protein